MRNPDELSKIRVNRHDEMWSTEVYGMGTYESGALNEYNWMDVESFPAKFDTSSPHVTIPWLYYPSIWSQMSQVDYDIWNAETGYKLKDCSDLSLLPSIALHIDESWLVIKPEQYVGEECELLILPSFTDEIVLGTPVMRGNYVIFDIKDDTVGFAPHKGSSNVAPLNGQQIAEQTLVWNGWAVGVWFIDIIEFIFWGFVTYFATFWTMHPYWARFAYFPIFMIGTTGIVFQTLWLLLDPLLFFP
jgi:hypothetical protein